MSDLERRSFEDYRRDALTVVGDKTGSSGRSTEHAYSVEARHCYREPVKIGGQIFDERWRRLRVEDGPLGVPVRVDQLDRAREHGLFPYPAAQALRWWFHAVAEAERICGGLCLETRLVEHRIEVEHRVVRVEAHALVSGEDRSNIMPVWGATNEKVVADARQDLQPVEKTG